MKLIELNPKWIGAGGEEVFDKDHNPIPERTGVGVGFDCPCGCESRCFIPFTNPLDGGPAIQDRVTWERTGDIFENLTLTPSILRIGGCAWHGFITNGEIVNA